MLLPKTLLLAIIYIASGSNKMPHDDHNHTHDHSC